MGEHAGRADHAQGVAEGVARSAPAIIRSRAAKVSCMLSEKLITMISGVITFRNMLSSKPSQPSAPSDSRMASQRRRRRHDHEGDAAEEQDGDGAAGEQAERIVDDAVALQRLADFELHHRHAGQLRRNGRRPCRSSAMVWRMSRWRGRACAPSDDSRARSDSTTSARSPVVGQQLAADQLIAHHALIRALDNAAPSGRGSGNSGVGGPPFSRGLARRKHRDHPARALDQLQVGDGCPQFLDRVAFEQRACPRSRPARHIPRREIRARPVRTA